MQGLWGLHFLDDQPEGGKTAGVRPTGLAGEAEGRIRRGTARITRHYSFSSGQAVAALLFLSLKALQQQVQPNWPGVDELRHAVLLLPFHGLLRDQSSQGDRSGVEGKVLLGPIIGYGGGTTVRQAWLGDQPAAFKQADSRQDEPAIGHIQHEISIMRSAAMQPLQVDL